MAGDIQFGIRIKLDGSGAFVAEVDQASEAVNRLGKKAKDSASEATSSVESLAGSLRGVGKTAVGAFAFVGLSAAVGKFIQLADASAQLQSQIKLVTSSAQQQAEVYQRLLTTANGARVGVSELATTYAQLARATGDMGISQDRLLKVTETMSKAITISGGSAASAQAAMVQLSQGFASGTLRGEELNSVMEQTPRLAQAIAQGLGVSIGQLRAMGAAGELTAEKVLGALERSAGAVAKEFGQVETTVGQSITVLGNSTLDLVGKFDKATGASRGLAAAIAGIGSAMDKIGKAFDEATVGDNWFANLNRRMEQSNALLARNQQLSNLAREAARPDTSEARRREIVGERAAIGSDIGGVFVSAAEFAADDARLVRSAETKIAALDSVRAAVSAYVNDKGNMSKAEQRTKALAAAFEDYKKATKGVAAGTAEAAAAAHAYAQAQQNVIDKFKDTKAAAVARAAESERVKDLEEQRKALAAVSGVTDDYVETLGRYIRLRDTYAITEEQANRAIEALIKRQPSAIALLKEQAQEQAYLNAGVDAAFALDKARADASERAAAAIRGTLEPMEAEAKYLGMSNELKARAIYLDQVAAAARRGEISEDQADQARARYEVAFDKINNKKVADQAAADMSDSANRSADAWRKAADDMNNSLTDSFLRSAENGKGIIETMLASFKGAAISLVVRPVISGALSPITNALSGGAGGGLSALGSSVGSLFGAAGGAFGGGLGAGMTSFGGIRSGLETLNLAGGLGALGSEGLAGTLASQGLGQVIGGAIPYLGAALALYSAFAKKRGGPKGGGSFSTTGERLYTPDASDLDLATLGGGVVGSAAQLAQQFGGSASGLQIGLGFDTDPQGTAQNRVSSFVRDASGRTVLDNIAGREVGRDSAELQTELATESKRVLLAALQASDLQDGFAEVFARLNPAEAAPEAIDNLITLAGSLRSIGEAAKGLPGVMGTVANLSATARESLLGLAGGLDALVEKQGVYYSEFFSIEEKIANASRVLTGQFGEIGLSFDSLLANVDGPRQAFRALVEGLDLTSEAGRQSYTALLDLAGPLDQYLDAVESLTPATEDAAAAVDDLTDTTNTLADTLKDALQTQIDAMTTSFGDLAGAMREIEPAAVTLVDAWRANKAEIEKLKGALGMGTVGTTDTAIARYQTAQGAVTGIQGARAGLQDRILDARLRGMAPGDQVGALRGTEANLWSQVGGSGDQTGLLARIEQTILRRIGIEGQIDAGGRQAGFDQAYASAVEAARLAKLARTDQIGVLTAQRKAAEEQISALERMRNFSRQIGDYATGLRIGDMSPLAPRDRIAEARDAFRRDLAGAAAGDQFAQGNLQGSAQAYLEQTRQFFASSDEYVRVFDEVSQALSGMVQMGAVDEQIALLQSQITQSTAQTEYLSNLVDAIPALEHATVDTSAAEVAALLAIDRALAVNERNAADEAVAARNVLVDLLGVQTRLEVTQADEIRRLRAAQIVLENALAALATNTAATADNTAAIADAVTLTNTAPAAVTV